MTNNPIRLFQFETEINTVSFGAHTCTSVVLRHSTSASAALPLTKAEGTCWSRPHYAPYVQRRARALASNTIHNNKCEGNVSPVSTSVTFMLDR